MFLQDAVRYTEVTLIVSGGVNPKIVQVILSYASSA
jgi:hypothetical protein